MSKISQRQQMNVPIRTRNNQQVQTDINLIQAAKRPEMQALSNTSNFGKLQIFDEINKSFLSPFSDYYLLSQLSPLVQELKKHLTDSNQYKTRLIVGDLAQKIYGLLARQCRIMGINDRGGSYYQYLLQKEKQLTKLQIKYGSYDRKIDSLMSRITQLQRQVFNLRTTLKNYQGAAEQNQLYKSFWKQFKQISLNARKITDFDRLLNQQILPKIKQFEINLSDVSKLAGQNRASKQKAAISRYALELDGLAKSRQVTWQTLSNSAAGFFTSIQHLNNDDWIQKRINAFEGYEQLKNRHKALLSMVSKNINQLIGKDPTFKKLSQINSLIDLLEAEAKQGFETIIVNGWIGLGVIHCHREGKNQDVQLLRSLIVLFQSQIRKLLDQYPQLNQNLTIQIKRFLDFRFDNHITEGEALTWLRQLVVQKVEVHHVEDVYHYYSKNDKDQIFNLRVLVKALIDELRRIANNHNVDLQLDQGLLQLLRKQKLEGLNVEDIIALFRSPARVCQVEVIVQKPIVITNSFNVGVPLKKQKAVAVGSSLQKPVFLKQLVVYSQQTPKFLREQKAAIECRKQQIPFGVPVHVTQQISGFNSFTQIVKVPIIQKQYVELRNQELVQACEKVLSIEQRQVRNEVPYKVIQKQFVEIPVQKQVSKTNVIIVEKPLKIQQFIPKVYKQSQLKIIQKTNPEIFFQPVAEFVKVQVPVVLQKQVIIKEVQTLIEKPIVKQVHCDCQKPDIRQIQKAITIYKQIPKQIIIQKCHFVQGNVQQKILQVACHTQIPFYKQIVKQVPIFIDKIVPLPTITQKLVIIQKQIPYIVERFKPIQLIKQVPVNFTQKIHVPVYIDNPVPVYIQKIVPKLVQIKCQRIVPTIVQVLKPIIIQKIVEKIVCVPKVIQVALPIIQTVEVPVFIQSPVLQIIRIEHETLKTNQTRVEIPVNIVQQVLVCQKQIEVAPKPQIVQVRNVETVMPDPIPQIVKEKIVQVCVETPRQVVKDRIVDRLVHTRDVVCVQQRVQVPLQIQTPVQIFQNIPIFYKQPQVVIEVHRVQKQKIVQVPPKIITQIKQVKVPFVVKQVQIREVEKQVIIQKPQLHIVQVQRQNIIVNVNQIVEKQVDHYLDLQKACVVSQYDYYEAPKQVVYLPTPQTIAIQKPIPLYNETMVVVQRPETALVAARDIVCRQTVKLVTEQKPVYNTIVIEKPYIVKQQVQKALFVQLEPKECIKEVPIYQKTIELKQINCIQQVPFFKEITKTIEIPVYMQKLFQKIILLSQVVEVEKKIYMIQQINSLIAKQVDLQTHQRQYREHVRSIQIMVDELINNLRGQGQQNMIVLRNKLTEFLTLLRTQSRIPKVVEVIKQVQVTKEKTRPVLVPAYDQSVDRVLLCIISDLVQGVSGLNKNQIQRRFPDRIKNLFAYQFGLSGNKGDIPIPGGERDKLAQSRWKSWLQNYDQNLPDTLPKYYLSQLEKAFIIDFGSKQVDYATLKASVERLVLTHKQKLYQIQLFRKQYDENFLKLRLEIEQLRTLLKTQRYYKDFYRNQLLKLKRLIELKQYNQLSSILHTITQIREQASRMRQHQQVTIIVPKDEEISKQQNQRRYAQLHNQLKNSASQLAQSKRQVANLTSQVQRLNQQAIQLRSRLPRDQQLEQRLRVNNQQWLQRARLTQQKHQAELKAAKQQGVKRTSTSPQTDNLSFNKTYEQMLNRYNELANQQIEYQNQRRDSSKGYEQTIKSLKKQIADITRNNQEILKQNQLDRKNLINQFESRLDSTINNKENQLKTQLEIARRNQQLLQKRNQIERQKLITQYESRMASTSTEQDRQQRQQLQKARRQLQQYRRNYQAAQQKFQTERRKLVDDYENKMKSSSITVSNQQRELKRQLDNVKRNYESLISNAQNEKRRITQDYQSKLKSTIGSGSSQQRELRRQLDNVKRNYENLMKTSENEKKRIAQDYQSKLRSTVGSGSNQERELRRQLQNVKRNYDNLVASSQNERRRISQDYEAKLKSGSSNQQKELRRQLQTVKRQLDNSKRNYETYQKASDSQKTRLTQQYERKIKQIQDDLERARTSRRGTTSSPEQLSELQELKQKIRRLQLQLDSSKKQIQSYQKSRLGQTSSGSGLKQSGAEGFQSPQNPSRHRIGEGGTQGGSSGGMKEQQQQIGRLTQPEKGRGMRTGLQGSKIQQRQQVRSSSSRISGGSQGSSFKSSMTLREFMDLKKAEDKDSIITFVMIKVIQKIQQQADKGIINSYTPTNIYLSNFNPNNLQGLIVKFGAPITNKKSKNDGLYLAPQVLRGQGTTLKSVVFSLAVIWDELIHYEIYYKSMSEIENLAHEYKVRDTSLNPILRNTLFEMMSKDPVKRLQLGEAKRRLSLQRYIVSEGKAGTTTSRVGVATQSRKNL